MGSLLSFSLHQLCCLDLENPKTITSFNHCKQNNNNNWRNSNKGNFFNKKKNSPLLDLNQLTFWSSSQKKHQHHEIWWEKTIIVSVTCVFPLWHSSNTFKFTPLNLIKRISRGRGKLRRNNRESEIKRNPLVRKWIEDWKKKLKVWGCDCDGVEEIVVGIENWEIRRIFCWEIWIGMKSFWIGIN